VCGVGCRLVVPYCVAVLAYDVSMGCLSVFCLRLQLVRVCVLSLRGVRLYLRVALYSWQPSYQYSTIRTTARAPRRRSGVDSPWGGGAGGGTFPPQRRCQPPRPQQGGPPKGARTPSSPRRGRDRPVTPRRAPRRSCCRRRRQRDGDDRRHRCCRLLCVCRRPPIAWALTIGER